MARVIKAAGGEEDDETKRVLFDGEADDFDFEDGMETDDNDIVGTLRGQVDALLAALRRKEEDYKNACAELRAIKSIFTPDTIPNPTTGQHMRLVPMAGAYEILITKAKTDAGVVDTRSADIVLTIRRNPPVVNDLKKIPDLGTEVPLYLLIY